MRTARVAEIVGTERGPGAMDLDREPVPGSLDDLFVRRAPALVRLAYLMTHDAKLAEDIVQDAFVKVTGRFGHMRALGAFDAYLRRTVVNLCLSHHRHAKVERDYVARMGARRTPNDDAADATDVETRDEVLAAVAQLPRRQRAVVVLRFYEDLSEQQIADALGCSATAARSLLFRAMGTLRERLTATERTDDQGEKR